MNGAVPACSCSATCTPQLKECTAQQVACLALSPPPGMQTHPLASLSSAARYASSPVRTSEPSTSGPAYGPSSASVVHSPEEYYQNPPQGQQSSPHRVGEDHGPGTAMTARQQQQQQPKRRRGTAHDDDRTSEEPAHANKKLKVLSCTECKVCRLPPDATTRPLTSGLLSRRFRSLDSSVSQRRKIKVSRCLFMLPRPCMSARGSSLVFFWTVLRYYAV